MQKTCKSRSRRLPYNRETKQTSYMQMPNGQPKQLFRLLERRRGAYRCAWSSFQNVLGGGGCYF